MENIYDIIIQNEGIIYNIINKYKNYFELDDLYQVAVIGFIKAYKNYQKDYNVKFISYAYPYILGEVIKYVNDSRSIKINKNVRQTYYRILKAKEILSQKLMKIPTNYELSIFLELDEKIIDEIMSINTTVDSLDRIINEDSKDLELYDVLGKNDYQIENYDLISEIENLPQEDKRIIISRYYEDKSQKEVGDELGMYQVEVSRKEKKILRRIKENIKI